MADNETTVVVGPDGYVPSFPNKLRVHKIASYICFDLPHTNCDLNTYMSAPKWLEWEGNLIQKSGFTWDGILYVHPEAHIMARPSLQDEVSKWTRSVFTTATPASIAERVVIEGLELVEAVHSDPVDVLHALSRLWDVFNDLQLRVNKAAIDGEMLRHKEGRRIPRIAYECADITQVLCDMATVVGFDLDGYTRDKLRINRERAWSEPDENNQRQHL